MPRDRRSRDRLERLGAAVDPADSAAVVPSCLNCRAEVAGAFCGACGQRVIPPYPTIREMAGDAWHELSGYDGRFARTFRLLLGRPGVLTLDVLEGRRARYVSPVRLYLVASLVYFLVAAAVPNPDAPQPTAVPGSGVTIALGDPDAAAALTPEERDEVLRNLDRAPRWMRPLLRTVVLDPAGFKARMASNLPRVLFALVPVFAAIVALFYRRRPSSQHLVFALHVHAAAFIALAVRELANVPGSVPVSVVAAIAGLLFIAGYALLAFRTVYRESWPRTLAKSAGVAIVYLVASLVALSAALAWAALT